MKDPLAADRLNGLLKPLVLFDPGALSTGEYVPSDERCESISMLPAFRCGDLPLLVVKFSDILATVLMVAELVFSWLALTLFLEF